MKMTLLEMTQDILSDMNSDEVTSITDTPESLQVANIIRTTYFEIISNRDWPHLRSLFQLESLESTSLPNYLQLPEVCQKVVKLKYNCKNSAELPDDYREIEYLYPEDFLDMCATRNSTADNTQEIVDPSWVAYLILNDASPRYWTSFDDENLVFDSYDSGIENYLSILKAQVIGYSEPTFTFEDSFIPDLPSKNFAYLLAEAKSTCFNTIAQEPNAKEEQKARRQRTYSSIEKFRTSGGIKFKVDYGR